MAWILATNRLYSPTSSPWSRAEFLRQMSVRLGISLDTSRISRLESGAASPSAIQIAAYEELTGQHSSLLHVVWAVLRRSTGDLAGLVAAEPLSPPLLDELIERVEGGSANATDWIWFAIGLNQYERIYLPTATWERLSDRLVAEITRSVGPARSLRYQAGVELIARPEGRLHLSRSIGRFVLDPDAQSIGLVLTLLTEQQDSSAYDLVLRLVGHPSDPVRRGAARAAATAAGRIALDADAAGSLQRAADALLGEEHDVGANLAGVSLALALSETSRLQLLNAARNPVARAALAQAASNRQLAGDRLSTAVASELAEQVEAALGADDGEPDRMLQRLVRELLFEAREHRRMLAAACVVASPFARSVARALVGLLDHPEPALAATAWMALANLGESPPRHELVGPALTACERGIAGPALAALAAAEGPSPDVSVGSLVDLLDSGRPAVERSGALATLALSDHSAIEMVLADGHDLRRAALWWRELGPTMRDAPRGPMVPTDLG